MNPSLLAIAALALCLAAPLVAEETIDVLRSQVEELKTDLDRPLTDFDQRYEAQLVALKGQAQQLGDLDLALATAEEIAGFKTGASKPSSDEKLKRLQSIYAAETARLKTERSKKLLDLLNGYRQRLATATEAHTKSGDLDGALTYRNETLAVESEIAVLSAAVATAATPTKPEAAPEPEKEEGPKFLAGVYQMGEGFGPSMTFYESGRYDARFFGSGRWKTRGDKMILNSRDEFSYDSDRDVWIGTVNFGGEREIVLKYTGDGGRGSDSDDDGDKGDKDDGDSRRGPKGRPDFRPGGKGRN